MKQLIQEAPAGFVTLGEEHIPEAEFDLYIRNRLNYAGTSQIQSHVRHCETCEQRLVSLMLHQLAGLIDDHNSDDQERRTDQRFQTGEYGYLQMLCPLSFDQVDVQILNVSKNGLGLLSTTLLPTGSIVLVRAGLTARPGEVRYCDRSDKGRFQAGIELLTARRAADVVKKA